MGVVTNPVLGGVAIYMVYHAEISGWGYRRHLWSWRENFAVSSYIPVKYPWGLPGGWLKYGEDADQAIQRELQEEAGFSIHVKKPLLIGRSKYYPRIDLVFLCEYRQGEFRPSAEVSEARFFEIEALAQLLEPEEYDLISQAIAELNREEVTKVKSELKWAKVRRSA